MDRARWNEIIEHCAGEAIDECPGASVEVIAQMAARLAAEAIFEALAEEAWLEEG